MEFSTASPRRATRSCSWLFGDYLEHSRCVLHLSPLPRHTFSFPPPVARRWLLLIVRSARPRCPSPAGRGPSRPSAFGVSGSLSSFLRDLRDPARFSFECQHRISVVVGGSPIEWSVGCGVASVVQVGVLNSSLYINSQLTNNSCT